MTYIRIRGTPGNDQIADLANSATHVTISPLDKVAQRNADSFSLVGPGSEIRDSHLEAV